MKVRTLLLLSALAAFGPLAGLRAGAQDDAPVKTDARVKNLGGGPSCGSGTIPRYFTPGNFPAALEQARKENRALLIKGVAFGMDRLGATEPTKGHW